MSCHYPQQGLTGHCETIRFIRTLFNIYSNRHLNVYIQLFYLNYKYPYVNSNDNSNKTSS